jgi:uridylate kinase
MKTILIKLSGGALGGSTDLKFSEQVLNNIYNQILNLQKNNYKIALVTGGGNLFRGKELLEKINIDPPIAHTISMLAIVQNGLVLQNFLKNKGLDIILMSSFNIPQVCETYSYNLTKKYLNQNKILIFSGGLGNAFFTTDTTAVQRSLEINADFLVFVKNNADGVYTSDPNKNLDAKKIDKITCTEILTKNLQVMDSSAIALARENDLNIRVIGMNELDKITDEKIGTKIIPE